MEQKKGTQWVPKKQEDPGLLARLSRPTGPVDVVLDTDTYNEIDDQFAVSYLICSAEKLHLQAIYAAPFFNEKSTTFSADWRASGCADHRRPGDANMLDWERLFLKLHCLFHRLVPRTR